MTKYGLGVFVAPPALPEAEAVLHVSAPLGVEVEREGADVVVRVPAGFVSDEPVRLAAAGTCAARFELGEGSAVRVLETPAGPARDLVVKIGMARASRLAYASVQDSAEDAVDRVRREATLAADAHLAWRDAVIGAAYARVRTVTRLEGEGAEVSLRGMYFGRGAQQIDLAHEAAHLAPRTRSDLQVRGALDGSAKAIVRGLIRMVPGVSGADGRLRFDALLLSPKAEVDAIPDLEIAHHEVACSHGATSGRPDAARLFYLMSRGLSREEAVRLLVEGFLAAGASDDAAFEERLSALVVSKLS